MQKFNKPFNNDLLQEQTNLNTVSASDDPNNDTGSDDGGDQPDQPC
jgi:hypothetical protein